MGDGAAVQALQAWGCTPTGGRRERQAGEPNEIKGTPKLKRRGEAAPELLHPEAAHSMAMDRSRRV